MIRRLFAALMVGLLTLSMMEIFPVVELVKANPAKLHVGPGQLYLTIQAAIDAANPGDVIVVHPGTYDGGIEVDKSLTICSTDGASVTIINARGNDYGFNVTADNVSISGFTVKNALFGINASYDGDLHLTLENNVITYNLVGVCVEAGDIYLTTIDNNIINNGLWGTFLIAISGEGGSGNISLTAVDNNVSGNGYAWELFEETAENGAEDTLPSLLSSGICMGADGFIYLTVASNTIENNTGHGVYAYANFGEVEGFLTGNLIANNTGDGIHIENVVFDSVTAYFNHIEGNIGFGVFNLDEEGDMLHACFNWWGTTSGPYHPTLNPGGLGNNVSDLVEFEPWLTTPIMLDPDGTGIVASRQTGVDTMLEFPDSNVNVIVTGVAEVYVSTYQYNPGGRFMGSLDNYIDVYVPDVSGLTEIEIRKYYTDEEIEALGLEESSLRLYWWSGTAWLECSDTGVNTVENYIWAHISATTTPSLADLAGTPFGAAGKPPTPPVGGLILPIETPVQPILATDVGMLVMAIIAVLVAKSWRRLISRR